MGEAETFSALQLFYPYVLLKQTDPGVNKTIRTFLLVIDRKKDTWIRYIFHEYRFRIPLVANSGELRQVTSVDLKIPKDTLKSYVL